METPAPIGLETPLDAVVFDPTSTAAIEATETKKIAFETLASDAVRRAGISFDTLIVHADRAVIQANTVVIPVTTHDARVTTKDQRGVEVPRKRPLLLGSRHLIVKHVDLNATSVPFRDETHRNRTRSSFACECAMYRERSAAPGAGGGDSGSWATPFVYLVEGDAEADAFTVVMDDAARPRPGALQKRQEESALRKIARGDDAVRVVAAYGDDGDRRDASVVSVGKLTKTTTTAIVNQTTSVMMHGNEAALEAIETVAIENASAEALEFGVSGLVSGVRDASRRTEPPRFGFSEVPGTCDFPRARAAVQWLASFHAHWWRGLPDSPPIPEDLWPRGGYWTLEKRDFDLGLVSANWRNLLDAFERDPDPETARESARTAEKLKELCGVDFGERLCRAGPALSRAALRSEWGTPHRENGCATLVHGDFKAANIVFRRIPRVKKTEDETDDDQGDEDVCDIPHAPTVIDWQWTGPGGAAHDLAFFLATSLSPDALDRVDDLAEAYRDRLRNDLRSRGDAGRAAAEAYSSERLRRDLDAHFADYARYLAGDIWKTLTPKSMRDHRDRTNMGAHRRSTKHLLFCAERGARGLAACEAGEPGDAGKVDPDAPPPRVGEDTPPLRCGPVSALVAELLGVCVALAEDAGDIARSVAETGGFGTVREKREVSSVSSTKSKAKGTSTNVRRSHAAREAISEARGGDAAPALDPQTQADRRAERLICDALRRKFGSAIRVFGEEASDGALGEKGVPNPDGTVDDDDSSLVLSDDALARVGDFVRDWEVLLPPELEVGPSTASRLAEASLGRRPERETASAPRTSEAERRFAACAESDVTVWVDPLDGTKEFVEGPEHWNGVSVLIGIAVRGVPVAGIIHQPFVGATGEPTAATRRALAERAAEGMNPERPNRDPEEPFKTFPHGFFGRGRTLWGCLGLGVFSHPGGEPHRAVPVAKPKKCDPKKLRVATTRSHPSPFVEGAVYTLHPCEVIRTGGAGGKVALMLDGRADAWVFPAKGTKRWDTCAGEALLAANRGGWIVRATDGAAYDYGSAEAERPGNVDGVIAGADKDLYPLMVRKWPWLNIAGGERVGPRDPGMEKD
jgi:3'(2'), 5'-bisphosphate nucleotidase